MFRADVTDRVLWAGRDEVLAIAHRRGFDGCTRCHKPMHAGRVPLGVEVTAQRAVEQVMQACPSCEFKEHR
jgi:hypothetical protein